MTETREQMAEAIHRRLDDEYGRGGVEEERTIRAMIADRLRREQAEAAAGAAAKELGRPGAEARARLEQLAAAFGRQDKRATPSAEERQQLVYDYVCGRTPPW